MSWRAAIWATCFLLAPGCVTGPRTAAPVLIKPQDQPSPNLEQAIIQAEHQQPVAEEIQPLALPTLPHGNADDSPVEASGLTLEALEQMALANNPAVAVSRARLAELRGKWRQVGLAPNPTIGYMASEIGDEGQAGQQGGYVGQQFITAHKLQRNRLVVAAEIARAEQLLAATHQRVFTDVRRGYYQTLLAQRRVEVAVELLGVSTEAVNASQSLFDAQELPLAGLLQTEVQQQNAQLLLRQSRNQLSQAWRSLSALIGGAKLPAQPLAGDVSQIPEALDWRQQLDRLQSQSPELASAIAEVQRARRSLGRALVEAIPNVNTQLSVQYDNATQDTIAGVQVGLPLPLWNRNQGGIRQATAGVAKARRNVERVELHLQQRLAGVFQDYTNAHLAAQTYALEILPRSQKTFDIVQQGYKQGEVGYLSLLAAQQVYSQTNLAYLDALGELWTSYCQIDGLLLEGSLQERLE